MLRLLRALSLVAVALCGLCALAIESRSQQSPSSSGEAAQPQQAHPGNPQQPALVPEWGTDEKPLTIKILPAPQTKKEAKKAKAERNEKAANERGLANATWMLALVTGLLFLVAVIQAGLFVWQLRLIRDETKDAAIAAKAARDSADTARTAMIAGDRAYVHFAGCRWISHSEAGTGRIFWRLRAMWTNSGNTPTRGLRVYVHYELRNDPLPDDYPFTSDPMVTPILATIAPKGLVESIPREYWGDQLVAVAEGRNHLYVWGIAKYVDVFPGTPERVTKFCVHATNITGNALEAYNAKSNIFDISFAIYDRHNCADEDCIGRA